MMLRLCGLHLGSRQHGWRFERLRPTFRRWLRIVHPPQLRSPLVKLDPESNKLIYICNGRVSRRFIEPFERSGRHYIRKGETLETPVLAFVKGGSHVLLETLSMDEVERLEKLIPDIRRAFDECESKCDDTSGNEHRAIDLTG
ncbi:hypothetical protein BBOV_III010095 [Babesia bovis T2Bo]|uniref:hypothetical protein n=1 Tax=Babesia bovis T2Bo TaxID=484906 RepID=UPI001C359B21|nr:hypothetical protein BBOV_III010095 [Babesia bovis T2Bo]KAG6440022.1 hypothetical protein BBOV_III010095 [Babesia bovis T2Bo]